MGHINGFLKLFYEYILELEEDLHLWEYYFTSLGLDFFGDKTDNKNFNLKIR